jgi:hypothetical protein
MASRFALSFAVVAVLVDAQASVHVLALSASGRGSLAGGTKLQVFGSGFKLGSTEVRGFQNPRFIAWSTPDSSSRAPFVSSSAMTSAFKSPMAQPTLSSSATRRPPREVSLA